jgi:hypothetical protein
MRRRLANSIIVAVIVIGLMVAIEFAYRFYLVDKYAHAQFGVTLVDRLFEIEDIRGRQAGDGLYLPNLMVRRRVFDADHRLLLESSIKTNAQGYRSAFDYAPPSAGEFRIAVLGDSLTAQHMSRSPWTDVVQRRLNADTGLAATVDAKRFAVYNFGVVGAGFDTFAQVYMDHARRFQPHLVLVNFITPDVMRHDLRVEPVENLGLGRRLYRGGVDVTVDSVAATALLACDAPDPELGRQGCSPSTVVRIDNRFAFDKEVIRRVKLNLSRQYTWSLLWRSTYGYALAAAMGQPFSAAHKSFADILSLFGHRIAGGLAASPSIADSVARSAAAVARLSDSAAPLVFLHNPTSGELLAGVDRTPLAIELAAKSGVRVFYMAEALGERDDADSVRKWFNLPHDSHFSDRGVEVYGGAVYRVVRNLLLSKESIGKNRTRPSGVNNVLR